MNRSSSAASLRLACFASLLAVVGCQDDAGNDEVGETGETATDDSVATFDGSSDSTSDSTDASTDSTDTATDTSTSTSTDSGTDTTGTDSGTDTTGTDTATATDTTDSGTDTSTDTGTDTGGDLAPEVIATTPANLAEGIAAATAITVSFSEAMDGGTVTTNTANSSCSGTLQVSADDFATCVRMAAAPSTGDDITYTITPLDPLASATTYQIRVLAEVTDSGGTPMAGEFTTGTGFTVRYFHTIVIDGNNDFSADEHFNTSSPGHHGHVAWDADYLYLGMESPDLVSDNPQIWFVAYLGGTMGTGTGVLYNSQQPLLPFDARWHLRWKSSDDYGGALEWNGMNWIDPGFGPIAGSDDVAFFGSFVEMRIAWADIEDPDLLDLHLGMLRETAFNEAGWAAVPAGSYVDGYDPDYTQYYQFDVLGSTLPSDHSPL